MNKAILVIDMPNECDDCQLRYYDDINDDFYHCCLTYRVVDWQMGRQKDCPLKEMPNKIDIQRQDEIDMLADDFLADKICESIGEERQGNSTDIYLGWNACLNKIIGDEDE